MVGCRKAVCLKRFPTIQMEILPFWTVRLPVPRPACYCSRALPLFSFPGKPINLLPVFQKTATRLYTRLFLRSELCISNCKLFILLCKTKNLWWLSSTLRGIFYRSPLSFYQNTSTSPLSTRLISTNQVRPTLEKPIAAFCRTNH